VSGGSLFAYSIKEFETFVESREKYLSNGQIGLRFKAHHEREQHLIFVDCREKCLSNGQIGPRFKAHYEREQHLVGNRMSGKIM